MVETKQNGHGESGFQVIGRETRLQDGFDKVTGRTGFAPNVTPQETLACRLLLSPYPSALITSIDTSAAAALPGVVRIVTAADLPEMEPASRHTLLLARDRVRFVGHPVAAVLAESEAIAEDALELIVVEYEPQPAVANMDAALRDDAPLVWPEGVPGGSDEAAAHGAAVEGVEEASTPSNRANPVHFHRGDVAQGFAEVEAAGGAVVSFTMQTPMIHQGYLEPHASIVAFDALKGHATVWTSTQASFYVREEVAKILGLTDSDVQVHPTPVGGAFGGKFILTEPLVALLSRLVGQPVKLVLTRSEEFLSGNPAPEGRITIKAGALPDGTLHALEAEIFYDVGIYPGGPGGICAILLGGYYRCPHLDIRATDLLTNRVSTGAYRGPGAPQASFAIESAMDELARALSQDPLDFRLRNAVVTGDPMPHGSKWGSLGLIECLEALKRHPAWAEAQGEQAPNVGWGLAVGGWPGGIEPASATCMLSRDGFLNVYVGSVDLNGSNTGFAVIAAEVLGISPDKVRVQTLDTDRAPYAGATGGSKITFTVGAAVQSAAEDARTQLLNLAATQLEAAPEDLEVRDGYVQVRGAPDARRSLSELASSTMQYAGRYAPIYGNATRAFPRSAPGFTVHLVKVRVDPEIGDVQVLRYVAVHDIGRAINKAAVDGQIMGGVLQGIGWALREQMIYDEEGQLMTASLMDYALPSFRDLPPEGIEPVLVEVPSEHGPFGARGIGEPPVIPVAGAIANAIRAATGARVHNIPMSAPRVLEAILATQPSAA